MDQQLVVFELAGEHYGLDIASVESIIKIQTITSVPQAPGFVEGVTNLRGTILPVIDLRQRFGMEKYSPTRNTRVIVVFTGDKKVGMIVDAVSQVISVSSDAVEPPPDLVTTMNSAFIKGIAKVNGKLIIFLDLIEVLNLEEKEII